MALNAYLSQVQLLLHDPNQQFFTNATLTGFINQARRQIALEGECTRGLGTFSTVNGQSLYQNSAVAAPATPAGIASTGLITARSLSFGTVGPLENRSWEWFDFYWRGFAAPAAGPPAAWSPFEIGVGSIPNQSTGSFYIGPIPNGVYTISVDGVWYPADLNADGDPEAVPYPWSDAVQFYACFLALLDSQRREDADAMLEDYELFMKRARAGVTPSREEKTFPGGLAARQLPGQFPPEGAR